MAGSLDELIDFLLGEIALGGGRGLTFANLVTLVRKFYEPPQQSPDGQHTDGTTQQPSNHATVLVDRPFLAKVWRWLGRHPDTAVGKEHRYDNASLDDIEKVYPGYTSLQSNNQIDTGPSATSVGTSVTSDTLRRASPQPVTEQQEGPRIRVNDERISIAICGHPPDVSRVHPSEWELMLHIAAAGRNGIVQGDLVRVSGQDKRSVPKRTDALHQKGYIEKRSIYLRGNKSSQLFLRKFSTQSQPDEDHQNAAVVVTGQPTIRHVIRQMFDLLRHNPLILQEDLRNALGMTDAGRSGIFSKIVRHFGKKGCIKRVKTALGLTTKSKDLKDCIQYFKDPDRDDLRPQDMEGFDIDQDIDALLSTSDSQTELPSQANEAAGSDVIDQPELVVADRLTLKLRTILPSWNPDRILANVLFEAAQNAGVSGLRNNDARNIITGPFVKRTLESLLVKISNRALQSQPNNLRHLAVLRTQEQHNGMLLYLHYSFDSFAERVKSGIASWKEVSHGETFLQELKKQGKDESFITAPFAVDSQGFPPRMAPELQEKNGKATMSQLLLISKAKDTEPRAGEPVLEEIVPGSFTLSANDIGKAGRSRHYARRPNTAGTGKLKRKDTSVMAGKLRKHADEKCVATVGRPRKFAKGTEKFWRDIFTLFLQQIDPDHVKKYGKSSITNDPRALKMYHERPEAFDQTILQAIELGLPIVSTPQDICHSWVEHTMAVINRSKPGLYLTPTGRRQTSRTNQSRLMIFRSPKLKDLDLCNRRRAWPWQRLVSSAAHSFRHQRFYPKLGAAQNEVVDELLLSLQDGRMTARNRSSLDGPPARIFEETLSVSDISGPVQTINDNLEESGPPNLAVEAGALADAIDSYPDIAHRPSRISSNSNEPDSGRNRVTANVLEPQQNGTEHTVATASRTVDVLSQRPKRKRKITQKAAENAMRSVYEQDLMYDTGRAAENAIQSGFNLQVPDSNADLSYHGTLSMTKSDLNEAVTAVAAPIHPSATTSTQNLLDRDITPMQAQSHEQDGEVIHNSTFYSTVSQLTSTVPQNENTEEPNQVVHPNTRKRPYTFVTSPVEDQEYLSDTSQRHNDNSPQKRQKTHGEFIVSRAQVAKLCRILVLELIGLCSGFVPNNPSTIKRAMRSKWQEAGVTPDQLTVKTLRAAVKALCDNGKTKLITFAFKGRTGIMNKMSLVALQSIDVTNPAVLELQNKMIATQPADYTPLELEAESNRSPLELNRKRYARILDDKDPLNVQRATPRKPLGQSTKHRRLSPTSETTATGQDAPQPSPNATPRAHAVFLTLEVPRIKELKQVPSYQLKYKPPPGPLHFNNNGRLTSTSNKSTIAKPSRRSGLRRKNGTRFDPETHKLIWKKPSAIKSPLSLEDIPNIQVSRDQASLNATGSLHLARFMAEVDCVATWEEKSHATFKTNNLDITAFISHSIPPTALTGGSHATPVCFEALIVFTDEFSDEIELPMPPDESWPPFVVALKEAKDEARSSVVKQRKRQARRTIDVTIEDENFVDDNDDLSRPPLKRQKHNQKEQKARKSRRNKLPDEAIEPPHTPLKRNRMTQILRYLSEEEKYHIVVAVIIVRTLAGGIEKFIDWRLVTRLLPAQEESVLRESWKTMLNRYRSDVTDLTESLQNAYIEALADGLVPTVHFDAVHTTDWEAIYRWALANLDKSIISTIEDLPATRQELLYRNDYVFEEFRGLRELLGYNVNLTLPRKEEAVSGTVFGKALRGSTPTIALQFRNLAEQEETDMNLSRAKSWIMATLFTREDVFDPAKIQRKLLMLAPDSQECETLLAKAVKSLQRDKLISRMKFLGPAHRGAKIRDDAQLHSLRAYEVSMKFFEQFEYRRMVTTSMLKHAADYKLRVMDPAFQNQDTITIAKDAALSDGEMVAILNLVAMGMLFISPGNDVPASRWGLDWQTHGYTTRLIDKKALSFTVVLSPVPATYVYGDPLGDLRASAPIPRGGIDQSDAMGRIPVWFDINHNFQPLIWEMVLGATLGLISVRPGISTEEICRTFWHGINLWEMHLILDWTERLHLVKKTSSQAGWESDDWWWMGVGIGSGKADNNNAVSHAWKLD